MNTKKKENEKKNNKGFSLVELIVVIAIMAVLVAVLAPQFTKYVDRSRQSVDATTVSGIVTAAQVGVADVTEYAIPAGTYTITVGKSGTEIKSGDTTVTAEAEGSTNKGNITNAVYDACGELSGLKTTANAWDEIIVTVKVENDYSVTIDYSSKKGTTENDDFEKYIGKTPSTDTTPETNPGA